VEVATTPALSGFAARRAIVVIMARLAIVGAGFGVGAGVSERLVPDIGACPTPAR